MTNPQANYNRRTAPRLAAQAARLREQGDGVREQQEALAQAVRAVQWRHKLLRVERKLHETLVDLRFFPNDARLNAELAKLEAMYKELIDEQH